MDINTTEPPTSASNDTTAQLLDYQVARSMQQYMLILLVIFGTAGHVLSFVVLSRPRMRYTSIYFYLFVLSCADSIVLWLSGFKTWIRLVADFELMHVSPAACKIVTFLYLFSTYMSSWLIVAMTTDRFTAVWFPLKASTLFYVRHARLTTLGLATLAIVCNLHVFWTYGHNEEGRCMFLFMFGDHYKFLIFEYTKLAAYCFIPFVIVLALNAAIIYKLKCGSKFLESESASTDTGNYDRIVYMLLTVSFTWFILTLPVSLIGFIDFLHNTYVARTVCWLLMYTNHSINFFIYCLTGRKFRRELKEALKCQATIVRGKFGNGTETTRTSMKNEANEKVPLTVIASGKSHSRSVRL